jgi:hexosaminidase
LRYGGLLARIDSAIKRLHDYLEHKIDKIEELEQERLYFDGIPKPHFEAGLGYCSQFHRIVSANSFYHALQL